MGSDYNQLLSLPYMEYKIVQYLMTANDDIWKLLSDNGSSALSDPPLTLQQKSALIYNGQPISSNYRVFMNNLQDDSFDQQCSIIRIFPDEIIPISRIVSKITFCIQCFSHVKIQALDGYVNRNVYLLQQVVQTLNGTNIGGVGQLSFDREGNPYDRAILNISNNRSFTGYSLLMTTNYADF